MSTPDTNALTGEQVAALWQTLADTLNALERAGQGPSPYRDADNGDSEIHASGYDYVVRLDKGSRAWRLKRNH